tara:strand:+ start:1558 stop:2322 length:765 start_codon:yes stop_codon:yes gene_type:complete
MIATVGTYKYLTGSRELVGKAIELLREADGAPICGEGTRLSGFVTTKERSNEEKDDESITDLMFWVEGPLGRGLVNVKACLDEDNNTHILFLSIKRENEDAETILMNVDGSSIVRGDTAPSTYSAATFAMTIGAGVGIGMIFGVLYGRVFKRSPFDRRNVGHAAALYDSAHELLAKHDRVQRVLGTPIKIQRFKGEEPTEERMHASFKLTCEGSEKSGVATVRAIRTSPQSDEWEYTARLDIPGRRKITVRSSE